MKYGDRFRVFNGKRYYYQARYFNKRSADALARSLRRGKLGARVVKAATKGGHVTSRKAITSVAYDVYATKKFA